MSCVLCRKGRKGTNDENPMGTLQRLGYGGAHLLRFTGAALLAALVFLDSAGAARIAQSLAPNWYTAASAPAPASSSLPCVRAHQPLITPV